VVELAVYRTVEAPAGSAPALAEALADPELAGVVFASGSAVRGFLGLGGKPSLPAVSIGPRTTQVARELGFAIAAEAAQQTTRELAEAVSRAFPKED
jgi:uroporphyrinogen-III synthase